MEARYYIWKRWGTDPIEYMTSKPSDRYHSWGTKAQAHKFTFKQAQAIIRVFENNRHNGSAEVWSKEQVL